MSDHQSSNVVKECAKSFMSRSQHPWDLGGLYIPGFLGAAAESIPGYRLPSRPADCCDLCEELEKLSVRAIGPDLRLESTEAIFLPCREYLVLKILNTKDGSVSWIESDDHSFFIYSHPSVPCPWYLFQPYQFQKLEWAFSKLKDCTKEHACWGKDPTPLPTRVIRVGLGPEDIHLETGGSCARYICLSHCWGFKQPLITNMENVNDHRRRLIWEHMPLLYQDTIRLAWRLGIEYVWIDSLCIIQDSPGDWAHEAGCMQDVYGNSWLTIAATSNPDCCSGILDNPRDNGARASLASFKDCIDWSGVTARNETFSWLAVPGDIDACERQKHEKGNCRWPLLTRGWVLQERLLSSRVLYFTAASLLWSCNEGKENENASIGYPTHMGRSTMDRYATRRGRSDPWLNRFWLDIVEDYSRLKLTNQGDRLPALSGLAQRTFQRMPSGERYLAGLWSSTLFQGLSWYHAQESHDRGYNASDGISMRCPRKLNQLTPSWSLAAIEGPVKFLSVVLDQTGTTIFHSRIGGTQCTPASHHDPTGNVSSGKLHIRGPISPFRDIVDAEGAQSVVYFDCPMHMDLNYLVDKQIQCLLLYTRVHDNRGHAHELRYTVGLLLERVEGRDSEYRRVGLVEGSYLRKASYHPAVYWFKRLSVLEDIVVT